MALAPLSRIVIFTEDGSTRRPTEMVTIPPRNVVSPDPVSISGVPPTNGRAGQPYSFTPSTAGGAGTKVYALASGTLLAGLSLNTSSGAITGTPTVAGTMTALSVRVTDDTGSAATTQTTVTIAAAQQSTVLTRQSDGSVTVASIAPPPPVFLARQPDGSVAVKESA